MVGDPEVPLWDPEVRLGTPRSDPGDPELPLWDPEVPLGTPRSDPGDPEVGPWRPRGRGRDLGSQPSGMARLAQILG